MQARRRAQPSRTNRPSSSPFAPSRSSARDLLGCVAWYALCGPQGARLTEECPSLVGGRGGGGTPGPMPNPEVKPPSADGTAASGRGRAGRLRPTTGIWPGQGPASRRGPALLRLYALILSCYVRGVFLPFRVRRYQFLARFYFILDSTLLDIY